MDGFVRTKTKRVTYPLDDRVKARLVGGGYSYVSSGSEHSGECDDDSPCLSELVHDFLEYADDSSSSETRFPDNESDSDLINSVSEADAIGSILRSAAVSGNSDSYGNSLRSHVSEAAEAFAHLGSSGDKGALRRSVMSFLRGLGHNAAICKARWAASGNVTAGSYEFIDVVSVESNPSKWQSRYIVDLDFAGEFEIARPTSQYSRLLQSLPRDFVGGVEDLKRIVRVMSSAIKRSLRSRELSVPPWRKNRYMQNKWFGPYKRTAYPANSQLSAVFAPVSGAKCRWVGFDDAVSDSNVNGRLYVRT